MSIDTLQTINDYKSCKSWAECFDFTWKRRPEIMLLHCHEINQINHKHEIPYYIFIGDIINIFEGDLNLMKKMNTNVHESMNKRRLKMLKTIR